MLFPTTSKSVNYLSLGLGVCAVGYLCAMGYSARKERQIVQSLQDQFTAAHESALAAAARATVFEDQVHSLRAKATEAQANATYWKARATAPVPIPQVVDDPLGLAAQWRSAGFPSATETSAPGTALVLADSRKALALVLMSPELSSRLQDALHAVRAAEDSAGAERVLASNYLSASTQWQVAYTEEVKGTHALKGIVAAKDAQLQLEHRWGTMKVIGSAVITGGLTYLLTK